MNNCMYSKNIDSRTTLLEWQGKLIKIETFISKDKIYDISDIVLHYRLYLDGNLMVKCQTGFEELDSVTADLYKRGCGWKEVPFRCFELFSITNAGTKREGYASVLLNKAIKDMLEFSKYNNSDYKLIFEREDSKETLPFYSKFGAEENLRQKTVSGFTPMIIHKLINLEEYEGTTITETYTYTNELQK